MRREKLLACDVRGTRPRQNGITQSNQAFPVSLKGNSVFCNFRQTELKLIHCRDVL